jgi:hypothetical protein
MSKDDRDMGAVGSQSLTMEESFQTSQTLHSLAPARLALRATFGVASRPVTTGLGSQSTITVFPECERIGVSMDRRDMRGEAGQLMAGAGLHSLAPARLGLRLSATRICVSPPPAARLSIEKSVFTKRTQLKNVEMFWNE